MQLMQLIIQLKKNRNEVIIESGTSSSRNAMDMENHVFLKAHNKHEYLAYVARLILHVREISEF